MSEEGSGQMTKHGIGIKKTKFILYTKLYMKIENDNSPSAGINYILL